MNVVSPPRISRPYVDPRAVTKKNRSSQDRPDGLGSSESSESRVLASSCVMFPSWRDLFRRVWLNIVAGTSLLSPVAVPARPFRRCGHVGVTDPPADAASPIAASSIPASPIPRRRYRVANAGDVFVSRPLRSARGGAAARPALFPTMGRPARHEGHYDRRCGGAAPHRTRTRPEVVVEVWCEHRGQRKTAGSCRSQEA